MRRGQNGKKGFTLIELLVVVLIIGILTAIALPQYQRAVEESRVSEAKMAIRTLKNAIEMRGLETGATSFQFGDLDLSIGELENDSSTGRDAFITKHFKVYIDEYVCRNSSDAEWTCGYFVANRLDGNYWVGFEGTNYDGSHPGKFICETNGDANIECSKAGASPEGNTWVFY